MKLFNMFKIKLMKLFHKYNFEYDNNYNIIDIKLNMYNIK